MKEVKRPKKPLFYYYGIVVAIILLFNIIMTPLLTQSQITEVDYGTFMEMIEEGNIGQVEVTDSRILFTDKDNSSVYKTGVMNDPTLTERLYEAGAVFTKEIEQNSSSLFSFLFSFIIPMLIFIGIGQYMNKKLTEQFGG